MDTFVNNNFDIQLDLFENINLEQYITFSSYVDENRDIIIFKCLGSAGAHIGYDPKIKGDDKEVYCETGKWYYKLDGITAFKSFNCPYSALVYAIQAYEILLMEKLQVVKQLKIAAQSDQIIDIYHVVRESNSYKIYDLGWPNQKYLLNIKKEWRAKIGKGTYLCDQTYEVACQEFKEIANELNEKVVKILPDFVPGEKHYG